MDDVVPMTTVIEPVVALGDDVIGWGDYAFEVVDEFGIVDKALKGPHLSHGASPRSGFNRTQIAND